MNIICKALTLGFCLFVFITAKPVQGTIVTCHLADVSAHHQTLSGSPPSFDVLDSSVGSDFDDGCVAGIDLFGSAERDPQEHLAGLICDIGFGENARLDNVMNSAGAKSVSDRLAVLASTDLIVERNSLHLINATPNLPSEIRRIYLNGLAGFVSFPGPAALVLGAGMFCILFVFTGTTQRQGVVRIESPKI